MAKPPNIFIYMIDTARQSNMSCYGYHRPTTPNASRIAEEGAIFDNHFVNSCWSLPSQASFFTGKYLSSHGCGDQYQFLEPGIPTLAEILKRHGYFTAAIQANPWVQQDEGNVMRGFEYFERPRYVNFKPGAGDMHLPSNPEFNIPSRKPYVTIKDETDEGACWHMVGWIEDWLNKHGGKEPWCLFVLTGETHMPLWPPKRYREQFLPPGYPEEKARAIPQHQFLGTAGHYTFTAAQWEIVRCLRDASMAYYDCALGEMFDNFRKRGILDDTVFVTTSDHGDTHGEHEFHTAHCQTELWDTMLHTPLIMRYPERIPAGSRVEHLAQCIDVMPTLLELAGIDDEEANQHMQGKSLLKAIDGEPIHEFIMAEQQKALEPMHLTAKWIPGFDYRVYNRHKKSARTLEWKYIWTCDALDSLYRITDDPDEQKNVIEENPAVAEELRVKMEDLLLSIDQRDFGDRLKHTGHVQVDPEIEKRLKAWGICRDIIGSPEKE